jgi:flagellar basal body rod protein FlgG
MSSVSSIALSGMNAAQTQLNASAHNVANLSTDGFHRQEVVPTETQGGGVATTLTRSSAEGPALETDVVAQLQAKNAFLANLRVFQTASAMTGALLDKTA